MRLGSYAAAAIAVLSAQLAWAAPQKIVLPPAPDLAGKGSGKQLVRSVGQACATSHLHVATATELSFGARAQRR